MKTLLFLCMTVYGVFGLTNARAQNSYSVKGAIIDSASNIKLLNTSVSLLHAKDSILVTSTRANAEGSFVLSNLSQGKYILLLSYPGYADYVDHLQLDSSQTSKDFKAFNMTLKATLLANVIIRGKAAAIKIKGDTTEFNAGSFNIEPNSRVEDLLKQLPGIQVDKDGKITAQGQTVNKVLVDGEEFFGDDPILVTKNIRADMVDKVQLYDKKSDQATFTGIDDGETTKTINIKLKEDKKNGYFGKLDAGRGTDKFYENQGMFNAFKAKQKFSLYGTLSNTGKTGLDWQDSRKYGSSSMTIEFSEDGGIMMFDSGEDEIDSYNGLYNGQGIPSALAGGIHYDSKFGEDKQTFGTNYKIGGLDVSGNRETISQNNLPRGIINTASRQNFENNTFRQKLDATYFVKLDTTATLKVAIDGAIRSTESSNNYLTESSRGDSSLLNTTDRKLSNEGDLHIFNISALFTKKLKKTGRTYTVNVSQSLRKDIHEGYLDTYNAFYNEESRLDSTQNVHQYKTNNTSNSVLNSNITYTEPLTKTFSLILNYGLGINNSTSDKRSYNKGGSGAYNLLDTAFSNDFELNQLTNQGGAVFNYRKSKTVITFGTKATNVRFNQYDAFRDRDFRRDFTNWNPQASYQYKFSQQGSFKLNYSVNNNQPNIYQIQPVRENTDPLNVAIGNPNLDPSFTNRFNVNYNTYKVMTESGMYVSGSYSFTSNAIVSSRFTDEAGKSTYQTVNLKERMPANFGLYASYSKKIKKIDTYLDFSVNTNGNTNHSYINNTLITSRSYRYSATTSLSKYKAKKYEIGLRVGPNYTTSETTLQPVNNNGWGLSGGGGAAIYLPGKVSLSSNLEYEFTAATASFNEDFERTLLNASITKRFFKQENLSFKVSGNDLLNQNRGFNRSAWGNNITQTSYTTIQRYFLFSVIWDFNKMGGTPTQQ